MAKTVKMEKPGKKCGCNPGYGVLEWILKAVGLWALAAGFLAQFKSADPTTVNVTILGWYFAGFLLFGIAKLAKWKACGSCSVHGCM